MSQNALLFEQRSIPIYDVLSFIKAKFDFKKQELAEKFDLNFIKMYNYFYLFCVISLC
ncbi:protein of unknown function [Legionella micdadei]|uniref:Uncharacterized protein n=1 Tax=Legionella micdadei TaxID=451 RepID=A0A098GE33_LEGMI|nr:protein of unknown function [Legionella micdadei]